MNANNPTDKELLDLAELQAVQDYIDAQYEPDDDAWF